MAITYIHVSLRICGCCDSVLQCNGSNLEISLAYSCGTMAVYPEESSQFKTVSDIP